MRYKNTISQSPSGKTLFLNSSNVALTNCIALIILYTSY
jgi:hypothetical protein